MFLLFEHFQERTKIILTFNLEMSSFVIYNIRVFLWSKDTGLSYLNLEGRAKEKT